MSFKSPTLFDEENMVYFISVFENLQLQYDGFKVTIRSLKNVYSNRAAGIFEAVTYVRTTDVICFKGKTVSKGGRRATATSRMMRDSQTERLFLARR